MTGTVRNRPAKTGDHSVGELVTQASRQLSDLVHQEMRLAKMEMAQKGKRAGLGGGMFGGAAMIGYLGLGAFVAAAIAGVAVALSVWASALIIGGALLALAGLLALIGRRQMKRAMPPTPEQAISGVKADVEEIRERAHR
jgi:Putative Actinobacterial Holin-X, holin superfamily III